MVAPAAGSSRQYSATTAIRKRPLAVRACAFRARRTKGGDDATAAFRAPGPAAYNAQEKRHRNPPWPPARNPKSCARIAGTAPTTARVRSSFAHRADGLFARRLPGQAGDRDRQHVERHQSVPLAFPPARRGSEARDLAGGGFPVEMPAITLSEPFQKPTTMLYRNLLAMETEELLRSYPADGCVLMGGCDKTTPALLMGAISMNLPAIFMPGRPDAARRLAGVGRWAAAPTSGSTGPSCAPGTSPRTPGSRWRTASRARRAIA